MSSATAYYYLALPGWLAGPVALLSMTVRVYAFIHHINDDAKSMPHFTDVMSMHTAPITDTHVDRIYSLASSQKRQQIQLVARFDIQCVAKSNPPKVFVVLQATI